jgi:hypothetical protein
MKSLKDIQKIVTKFNVKPRPEMRSKVLNEALEIQRNRNLQSIPATDIWRIIMKSRITKFAAAAVIIITLALTVTFLDKSIPSAYALEQTMKAYEGLRYVHIKDFKEGESEPKEFWVELDEQEQVKKFRASLPAWDSHEGPLVAVWSEGKLQIWGKKDNVVVTKHAESFGLEILESVKKFDPVSMVKELHQLETEGKAEIKTIEPKLKSEPIIITAKILSPSSDAGNQLVLSIDQNTKMVTRVVFNKAKEFDGHQHSFEFSDYNIAVDESFFTLSEVPENVKRIKVPKYDRDARYAPAEIGLVQDKLGDNEVAVELARHFIQAMIDKDYDKAGKLCKGTPADNADNLRCLIDNKTFKKILCIEQPTRDANSSTKVLNVPCVVAAKWGNTMLVLQTNIRVEPYTAYPNRWVVDCNDIYKERPVITADPTDTTTTFLKNINSKLASLDINKSTADDVIAVLGEPWGYRFHDEDLEKDNLPDAYTMDYPGNFIVSIYKNQVMLWGCEQIPGHEIPGYIFSDSIQIGTTLDDVFKKLGSPAKVVEGFDDGSNKKVMYEDNVIYENMDSNQRKGFCFYWYKNNGGKVRIYFDDDVLYKNMNKTDGFSFYGTFNKGKRTSIIFLDNKVFRLYEYRTEPIKNIE